MKNLHLRIIYVNDIAFLLNFKSFYFIFNFLKVYSFCYNRLPLVETRQRFFLQRKIFNYQRQGKLSACSENLIVSIPGRGKTGVEFYPRHELCLELFFFMSCGRGV